MKEKDSVSVWNFGPCVKEKCWCEIAEIIVRDNPEYNKNETS